MDGNFKAYFARMTNSVRSFPNDVSPTRLRLNTHGPCLFSCYLANLVLEDTVERIYHQDVFAEQQRGLFLIRGENVVLLGEVVRLLIPFLVYYVLPSFSGRKWMVTYRDIFRTLTKKMMSRYAKSTGPSWSLTIRRILPIRNITMKPKRKSSTNARVSAKKVAKEMVTNCPYTFSESPFSSSIKHE